MIQFGLESPEVQEEAEMRCDRGGEKRGKMIYYLLEGYGFVEQDGKEGNPEADSTFFERCEKLQGSPRGL